ncbi:DUF6538 domain-containing protein [Alteripontixanthobacter muriae]|uniref:DUF6538 domain-containing protein n=1 Tax=Alteripontixanthobacter muriae TaxID=2705546 RepID=UPI0038B996B5
MDSRVWNTEVDHKRSVRGQFVRRSIYQIRVRVSVDLREAFGCSHVKPSLRTDSPHWLFD